ncbi:hypothetical protein G9A89_016617 [Geosiphon pyriformis]|nr:hypothetical protein G9A89_016617 [Geosiphon pyriformis]
MLLSPERLKLIPDPTSLRNTGGIFIGARAKHFSLFCRSCSLPCYKTHKSNPCNKPSELRPKLPVFPRKEIYNEYEESEESDSRLKLEQLDKIEKSSRIREFLKDDKLREIIGNIDNYANSTEPEKMLLQALQNDKMFYDFSQHILDIVLPQEDQSGDDAELENFFASDPK